MQENQQLQNESSEKNQLIISPNYLEEYLAEIGTITANNKNVEAIFYSNAPQISLIKKEFGVIDLQASIVLIVNDVLKFFNVGKTMNDIQMAQTVDLIIEKFPLYKLDDISLCFREAKSGLYGPVYDRIDGQVIMNWLYLYDANKTNEIIDIQEKRKSSYKKIEPITDFMPEDIKEELDKILPPKKFTIAPTESKQSEIDRKCNEIYREFDQLYKEQKRNDGSVRMIEYEGQVMDIYTFISKKLEL